MLVCIPEVLSEDELRRCQSIMAEAEWEDGRSTAGAQSASVKYNQQVPQASAAGRALSDLVLDALARNATFHSAALPLRIIPPLFSRYLPGHSFGVHVDNAIRGVPGTSVRIRTDLSCTLFLADPAGYDGGELTVETSYGAQEVKLPAGDLVLYPSTSLHRVAPVTRGMRVGSFFWLQSMVRSEGDRDTLFQLDQSIQELAARDGVESEAAVRLTGIYHNLVRRLAEI